MPPRQGHTVITPGRQQPELHREVPQLGDHARVAEAGFRVISEGITRLVGDDDPPPALQNPLRRRADHRRVGTDRALRRHRVDDVGLQQDVRSGPDEPRGRHGLQRLPDSLTHRGQVVNLA